MTGFEPGFSGIGRNCVVKWATIDASDMVFYPRTAGGCG